MRLMFRLLLIIFPTLLHANNSTGRDNEPMFTSRHITTIDGLQSNIITSIAQDAEGYIWIGTNCGLSRFDGYNILNFNSLSPDPNEVTDMHIANIFSYADSMVVETANMSLATYDVRQGKFTKYIHEGKFTGKQTKSYRYTGIPNVWYQGEAGGYKFFSNPTGKLWMIPDKGGKTIELDLLKNKKYTSNKKWRYFIDTDHKGHLYIATYGNGLFKYRMADGKLTHYTAQDDKPIIKSNYLFCLDVDRDGCIWTGSEGAGVTCIVPNSDFKFKYIYPEPDAVGDWSNYVRSINVTGDNEVYVGTWHNKVYRCDINSGEMTRMMEVGDMVFALKTDRHGKMWTGTRGSGIYVDGINYSQDEKEHQLPARIIYDLEEDKRGRMWIATWNKGLIMAETADGMPARYTTYLNKNVNQRRIHDICIDQSGTLWIATNNGIYSLDTGKEKISETDIREYNAANKRLPANEVICLYRNKGDKLWAGITGHGMVECIIDGSNEIAEYKEINKILGLKSNTINSIGEDNFGNLWSGTDLGIYKIHPEYLDPYRWELAGDMAGNTFAENAVNRTKDGKLLFGTMNGLLVIESDKMDDDRSRRPCVITDLQINGESIHENHALQSLDISGGKVELSYTQNNIDIYFSDFNYAKSKSKLYQYYMDGVNGEWQNATTLNHVTYNDLRPGTYKFHVRSINRGQEQSIATLTVRVAPPFYASWWAIAIYILAAALLAFYFYRNWRKRLEIRNKMRIDKEMSEMRINFFTHVAHEFRTPLAIIQGAVERLNGKDGLKAPQATLATINRGTTRLLRQINQILDFRKINTNKMRLKVSEGDIITFVHDVYKDFWNTARQKEINMVFIPFNKHYAVAFDHEKVETIIYNLLSNAVKYTDNKGEINMTVKNNADVGMLTIRVSNTGQEIPADRRAHLFTPFMNGYAAQGGMGIGLHLARQMALTHKGDLTYGYDSQKQAHTFTLTLPADNSRYSPDEYQAGLTTDDSNAGEEKEKSYAEEIIREMNGESLNEQHVAIIEDDPDMMELFRSEIGKFFKIDAYTSGEQGYQGIVSSPPSILICDVILPDLNGYEIVKRLKSDPAFSRLPVIMLTALNDESHQIRGYKSGADDYMVKPCNTRILIARIIQLIRWYEAYQKEKTVTVAEKTEKRESDTIVETKADKLFREQVAVIITQHLSEPDFNVDRIAEMMHMGRTKFYGKMKELTGISPNKYIQNERMRIAADMLVEGRYNVNEISMKVGIQDTAYFYKCFKAKYGVAPSQYAKTVPNEE